MKITRHFEDRWLERVSDHLPTSGQLIRILSASIPVQKVKTLCDWNGDLYTQFAVYWNPEENIIIKTDEQAAITVMSTKMTVMTPYRYAFRKKGRRK